MGADKSLCTQRFSRSKSGKFSLSFFFFIFRSLSGMHNRCRKDDDDDDDVVDAAEEEEEEEDD